MDPNIPSAPLLEINETMLIKSLVLLNKKLHRAELEMKELKHESKLLTDSVSEKIYSLQKENEKLKSNDICKCILCLDKDRNVLFRPCNHFLICDTCSGSTNFTECIVCKYPISDYEYAYF